MFTDDEILLIRAGLILRLDRIKSRSLYEDHKRLLRKLWALREELLEPRLTTNGEHSCGKVSIPASLTRG